MPDPSPVDPRLPWVEPLDALREARAHTVAGPRMRALTAAGRLLGDTLRSQPRVVSVRTLAVTDLVYPTRFAFNGACSVPVPMVLLRHRCLFVQVRGEGVVRNVLFNPTDRESCKATPFFRNLLDRYGGWLERLIPAHQTVEAGLAAIGVLPQDIDVVAFDHFHTQDLRRLLGPGGRFPSAYLLAPRAEWEAWDDLHPMQRAWFIADGKEGVPESRVVLTEGDLRLGDGCALIATPGHTAGNQTLVVHGQEGLFGCSENGTSADSWAPHASPVPGLRRYCRDYGLDVVINANTPEWGAEQYTSMMLERSIVDPVPGRGEFVQMFPSSELTPSPLAPGVRPAMIFSERTSGQVEPAG